MFALTAVALLAAASPALAGVLAPSTYTYGSYAYAPAYSTYGYAPTYATTYHAPTYAAATYHAPAVTTVHKTVAAPTYSYAAPAYTYAAPTYSYAAPTYTYSAPVTTPVVKTVATAPVAHYAAPAYYGFGYGGVYTPVIKK